MDIHHHQEGKNQHCPNQEGLEDGFRQTSEDKALRDGGTSCRTRTQPWQEASLRSMKERNGASTRTRTWDRQLRRLVF